MLTIDFEFTTKYGKFSDAIVLPEDHDLSDEDIDAMKHQRLANWIAVVEGPNGQQE